MSWKEHARAHLAEHLDKRGDLAPPWERFPTYERCTIGWRMGEGESWLGMWEVFNEELAPDAAGTVTPPWRLGLDVADFADSFDDDMGYVDAFRLWGMSAFDDRETLRRYLNETDMPASWEGWVGEQFFLD